VGNHYPFFKAYDVRARVPDELDAELAYRIGRAFVVELGAQRVAVGRDMRLSSPELADALIAGITDGGADVLDVGLCGTEEVYSATFSQEADGGVMVTASHNPKDYNGLKFVREQARPISADTGLFDIEARAYHADFPKPSRTGTRQPLDQRADYIDFLLGQIKPESMKPLTIVANPGNGGAGLVVQELEKRLPLKIKRMQFEPDGELTDLENAYRDAAESVEHVDGLSMNFGNWRFNLRMSNTEPVVRLNVETRGDQSLLKDKADELLRRIDAH
jgi:phosphomannomutase